MGSRPSSFSLTAPGAFRLYSTAELLKFPPPTWLIDRIIPANSLVALVGPPNEGKTFVALDMALCVSTGLSWQGHEVAQGYVLYISAEGGAGISKRVAAWLQDRCLDADDAAVAWLMEALNIHSTSEEMEVVIKRVMEEVERRPTFIIIDTLARCLDGDENQQEDMGRFVAGADKLRSQFEATVMVLHHTRLDGSRERGSTSLKGAADTMMFITRATPASSIEFVCGKQKDAEWFEDIELKLKLVPEVDSCVIAVGRQTALQQNMAQILRILADNGPLTWADWCQRAIDAGTSKKTFSRYLVTLRQSGQIIKENGKYVACR